MMTSKTVPETNKENPRDLGESPRGESPDTVLANRLEKHTTKGLETGFKGMIEKIEIMASTSSSTPRPPPPLSPLTPLPPPD